MATIKAGGYYVKSMYGYKRPLCAEGQKNNITILFRGGQGNAPRLGLWSSVVFNKIPTFYTTSNASDVLTLVTNDGRDDSVKLCNGIGKCDFSTGTCSCPYGWESDADLGPCGALVTNTSRWPGIGRCPGIVTFNSIGSVDKDTQDRDTNHMAKMYISLDPVDYLDDFNRTINSTIWRFTWRAETIRGAKVDTTAGEAEKFLNLTSHKSAGPLVLDAAKDRIFFVDNSYRQRFIGIAPQYDSDLGEYTIWLKVQYEIYGLTLDAHFARRRVYWSVPKYLAVADGQIYYASMDDTVPTVYTLASVIGQVSTSIFDSFRNTLTCIVF